MPVIKRYWKQHELWDGTYVITDLLDIIDAMQVRDANKAIVLKYELDKLID